MKGPSILVTGAAGYLGRLVLAALAERRDALSGLVGIDVRDPAEAGAPEGADYLRLDVTDPALADVLRDRGVDRVVHLASIVRPPKGAGEDLAYRVDVLGTQNVLEACAAAGATHLTVTSSGAAYGYHPDNRRWLEEDDPLRGHPRFAYARNKKQVEALLADWRGRHPELHQLVLRPGTILGETTRSPITDLFEKPVMLGVLGADSPFVFIWDRDVVACVLEGALEGREGIYNLAGDGALTPRELARLLGKPYLPVPAALLTGGLAVLRRLGLTQYGPEQVDFLRYRPVLSNRRLKEELGFVPAKTSREAFDVWHRAHA